jgi:arylsulfatase A-like enzyme
MMRDVWMGLAAVLVALATGSAVAEDGGLPDRPNIVVIMADDMGYGDLSCYDGRIETPRLDALAQNGMRFTDFHSSGPVCSPTRAGLLTGRYQQRANVSGVVNADPEMAVHHTGLRPDDEITFAELLNRAGYATAVFGKWHVGYHKRYNPLHHGFDEFRGFVSGNIDYISHYDRMGIFDWWNGLEKVQEEGYSTHLITEHATRFIEENRDEPFCLYVAHEAPHRPYQKPGDDPVRREGEHGLWNDRKQPHAENAYCVMVEELDKGVGKIVDTLKEHDLAEDTLVFFFSDNGANRFGSNGPLRGHKGSVWEGGHRVPAIAWWPGQIEPGSETDATAISIDLMPTMLDLASVPAPYGHELDGVSLRPVLLKGEALPERTLFWEFRDRAAVRRGPWKLVVNQGPHDEKPRSSPRL